VVYLPCGTMLCRIFFYGSKTRNDMALLVSVTGVLTWLRWHWTANTTGEYIDFAPFFCTMYTDRAFLGELIRLAGWSKYSFWSNSMGLSPTIPLARHGHFHVILGIHFYLCYLTCIMSFPHVHVDQFNHLWNIPLLLSTPYIHLVCLLSPCIHLNPGPDSYLIRDW